MTLKESAGFVTGFIRSKVTMNIPIGIVMITMVEPSRGSYTEVQRQIAQLG